MFSWFGMQRNIHTRRRRPCASYELASTCVQGIISVVANDTAVDIMWRTPQNPINTSPASVWLRVANDKVVYFHAVVFDVCLILWGYNGNVYIITVQRMGSHVPQCWSIQISYNVCKQQLRSYVKKKTYTRSILLGLPGEGLERLRSCSSECVRILSPIILLVYIVNGGTDYCAIMLNYVSQ